MKNVLHESITNIAYRIDEKKKKKKTGKKKATGYERIDWKIKKKLVMNVCCSKFVNMPN